VPLHLRLWSAEAPDYASENHQLLDVVRTVHHATEGRGIFVIDRGGDRIELLRPFLNDRMRFIVRLVGDRHLIYRGHACAASDLAKDCQTRYAERVIRQTEEGEKAYQLEYGFWRVRLPNRTDDLALVVVRGFGETPLMLLTNVAVTPSRASLWAIVKGYLGRWMVEETIRFIKQSYRLEEIRVLKYERLQNLVALVAAAAYFAAVWLGEGLRLAVLRRIVAKLSKRFFGVPAFHYYALADGIRNVLVRAGRWRPSRDDLAPPQPQPRQLFLF
jgi:Transposase DDE domain